MARQLASFHCLKSSFVAMIVGLLGACSDLAGLGTPGSIEAFGSTIAAFSFSAAPNSGVKAGDLKIYLTSTAPYKTPAYKELLNELERDNPKDSGFADFIKRSGCAREAEREFAGSALVLSAWGQWAYNALISEIDGRLAKLKASGAPPVYEFRRTVTASWSSINCIIVHRGTKNKENPKKSEPEGLTAVIRTIPVGPDAYIFRLVYLRLENSIAVTGIGTAEAPPEVQVDIAFAVSGARRNKGKPAAIDTVATLTFAPVTAKLGATSDTCSIEAALETSAARCRWESNLIPEPADATTAYAIVIGVKETGSIAEVAEKAQGGLKALTAITTPAYQNWLKAILVAGGIK